MLRLAQDQAADQLLSDSPLALLIGLVLDQQIPLERAFRSPLDLQARMDGRLDAAEIAATDPDRLVSIFAEPPALHRFPSSMAKRVQDMCQVLVDDFSGDASRVWKSASTGQELYANARSLPGFGEQKAKIFVALLAKQLGVAPPGWEKVAEPFGASGSYLSVADIDGPESLARVRAYKQSIKAKARADASPGR